MDPGSLNASVTFKLAGSDGVTSLARDGERERNYMTSYSFLFRLDTRDTNL